MYRLSRWLLVCSLLLLVYLTVMAMVSFWPQSLLPPVVVVVLLLRRRTSKRWTTLGSARWANETDVRDGGLVGGSTGLSIGHLVGGVQQVAARHAARALLSRRVDAKTALGLVASATSKRRGGQGPVVRLNQAVHTAVFCPSGGGKNVSFVAPFLQTCPDSCIVNDPKGESAKFSGSLRAGAFGHRVVYLDPFNEVTPTPDTLNPLDFIDKDSPNWIDDCVDTAKALVVRTGEEKDPHFNDASEMFIAGVMAMVVYYGNPADGTRSLQTVREILSHPDKLQQAIRVMVESPVASGMLARMGGQLLHFVDKEKSSVLTTASRHLRFLDTLSVSSSTRASSFSPADLRSGKTTIYLVLPVNRLRSLSGLARTWLTTLLRAVVNGGLQEKRLTHVLLDEAASLGHLEVIDDAISQYRGYGVRLQFYFQSMGQLEACFPQGGAQTLLSNTTQVFMAVNDQGLAGGVGTGDYVSARLGDETVLVDSGGTNIGTSTQHSGGQGSRSVSHSSGSNSNWGQQVRRLLQPSEVVALHPRLAITFARGVPPILSWPHRYYETVDVEEKAWRRAAKACKTLAYSMLVFTASVWLAWQMTAYANRLRDRQRYLPVDGFHFDRRESFGVEAPTDRGSTQARRSYGRQHR